MTDMVCPAQKQLDVNSARVIGIVGGMGPQSGLALFNSILSQTNAVTDQQHFSTILMSFPGLITDRTSFLLGFEDTNPAFAIVKVIRKLECAGASVIGIACNTAHSPEIYDVILEELDKVKSQVNLVNMPFETCCFIKHRHPQVRRVGLMTTNGTYKSGVYRDMLQRLGYDVIIPDDAYQNEVVHRMIYDPGFGIKANTNIGDQVRSLMDKALLFFLKRRADLIILGCTELSLVLSQKIVDDMIILDSMQVFAKALIREAAYGKTERQVP